MLDLVENINLFFFFGDFSEFIVWFSHKFIMSPKPSNLNFYGDFKAFFGSIDFLKSLNYGC